MEEVDVMRAIRIFAASWYPVLEKEGFEVDVNLPEQPVYWKVDPQWFTRILDNLFQNIVRHAKSGHYAGIRTEVKNGVTAVVVADKGPGIKSETSEKGAGIGLSIVSLMVKEMNLKWEMVSSPEGTTVYLYPVHCQNVDHSESIRRL
jgi:signal transduction histidine kinase